MSLYDATPCYDTMRHTNIVTWHSANHTSASHDCYCTYGHKLHRTQLCPITWTITSCDHTHTHFSCVTPMAPSPLETVEHLILHLLPNHLLCYLFHLLISYTLCHCLQILALPLSLLMSTLQSVFTACSQ